MGKFGNPHKLCIIRTLEFVYFSFLGSFYEGPMGKFGSPHKLCIIRTLEQYIFPFFPCFGVNLEVPINCVLLKHWNKYVFPFWCHSARAQWVNLEVPINCV